MKKTFYSIAGERFEKKLTLALVSDLHGQDPRSVIDALAEERPDYILLAGDIFESLDCAEGEKYKNGLLLLTRAAELAPTVYCTGNHEDGGGRSWHSRGKHTVKPRSYHCRARRDIEESGVAFIEDGFVFKGGIAFGGLMSGIINEGREPHTEWLDSFCRVDTPRVLICHHPEYYEKYLKDRDIDLIVSGHAHGGQWRIFGRGVFAPGQGLFPRFTAGMYEDRLVVSRGLGGGPTLVPRINNPREIVVIDLWPVENA
jgi:predicted MPP superfamily phosphohydrolase